MNLVWMRGFSGSGHDQVKSVKATPDGGMLAVIETASSDGDMTDLNKGLFDLVVVKYDASGNVVWARAIGGKNIESTDAGIDLLASGNVILAGYTCSGSGDFEGTDYFGDLFDLFAAELDASTGEVEVAAHLRRRQERLSVFGHGDLRRRLHPVRRHQLVYGDVCRRQRNRL